MKAAIFREFGPPSVLKYEEVATPSARPGHVVIQVLASGVNRLEHYIREGSVTREIAMPHILGSDAVGQVAELGAGVSDFKVGDRVLPMPGYPLKDVDERFQPMSAAPSYAIGGIAGWGTYAQYAEVPAKWLLHDNTGVSVEQLATLPMVLVTGVRAVKEVGQVKNGDRVLIHAGASGTGSMNLQIAKALGASVAATVRGAPSAALAQKLGADLVIDTEREDFVKAVRDWTDGRGVDVVIDNLGGDILPRSLEVTRTLGTVVAMGFVAGLQVTFDIRGFFFGQRRLLGTLMGDVADFRFGLDLVKAGKIRTVLHDVIPLEDAARAHELLAEGKLLGNLVLKP